MKFAIVGLAVLCLSSALLAESKPEESGPGKAFLKFVELMKAGKIDDAAAMYADKWDGRKAKLESVVGMVKSGELEMTLVAAFEDNDVGAVVMIQKLKDKPNATPIGAIKVGNDWKLVEIIENAPVPDEQRQRLKKIHDQARAREKELDAEFKRAAAKP